MTNAQADDLTHRLVSGGVVEDWERVYAAYAGIYACDAALDWLDDNKFPTCRAAYEAAPWRWQNWVVVDGVHARPYWDTWGSGLFPWEEIVATPVGKRLVP